MAAAGDTKDMHLHTTDPKQVELLFSPPKATSNAMKVGVSSRSVLLWVRPDEKDVIQARKRLLLSGAQNVKPMNRLHITLLHRGNHPPWTLDEQKDIKFMVESHDLACPLEFSDKTRQVNGKFTLLDVISPTLEAIRSHLQKEFPLHHNIIPLSITLASSKL